MSETTFLLANLLQNEVCTFSFRHLCVNHGKLDLDHSCRCLLVWNDCAKQQAATMGHIDREKQMCCYPSKRPPTWHVSWNNFVAHQGICECSELSCLEVGIGLLSTFDPRNSPREWNWLCSSWADWFRLTTSVTLGVSGLLSLTSVYSYTQYK